MSATRTPGQPQAAVAAPAGTALRPVAPSRSPRRGRAAAAPALLCALALAASPLPARAAPDPLGGGRALLDVPLALAGDALAAAGLSAAAAVALLGDGISLLDANRASALLLQGRPHAVVHQLAAALSGLGTGSFEALRGEDVERWPEPAAAYRDAAPAAGRFDTAASGVAALLLAPGDLLGGLALALARGAGAHDWAGRLERAALERRIRLVGPAPLPPDEPPQAAQRPDSPPTPSDSPPTPSDGAAVTAGERGA